MLSQLFDSIPDALIVVDRDGTIVLANAQADRLFGYPRHGLERLPVEDLLPQGLRARHRVHRAAYAANPRVRPMGGAQLLTGQHRDGRQFPLEIALSPLKTGHGPHFLASIRDVSGTHRTRQALVRARYDTLVARIGQLALETADEVGIIEAIPALLAGALDVEVLAVAFQGADQDSVELRAWVGLDDDWLAAAQAEGSPLASALSAGRPFVVDDAASGSGVPFPVAADTRSGALVPMLDRDRPMGALIAMSSQPRRFDHDALHLLQSVANLLAALVQRRRTEDQLAHSQRLEAIGQLTGGIAHDFNNLLTVISGSLQLLADEAGQRPGAAELIDGALRSVARGAELTSQLLAFARRQRLTPSAVEAPELLRNLQSMLARTLGELIRIDVVCDADLPAAFVDAMQLETALVNLALNARDAMPRGGEIALAASERRVAPDESRPDLHAGHYIVFSVTDTGHGMSQQTQARAIEPFFTTKAAGRGSGLGLSMVYGFVRQSGGALHIDSQLGYGTRVELLIPVAATTQARPSVASASDASDLARGGGQSVLVVEDEAAVRRIAGAFLQSLGYRVRSVATAEEALRQLQADPDIDLLFSDIMLGSGMDGAQLARAARQLRPHLAVLLTSGHVPSLAAQHRQADGLEILRKPYRREHLAEAVRRRLAAAGHGT